MAGSNIYVGVAGPSLETSAERRFFASAGGDAIGMSTIPEDIVAVQMGVRVLGFSVLTDECFPDALKPATVEEIIAVANKAEPNLTAVMKGVIEKL